LIRRRTVLAASLAAPFVARAAGSARVLVVGGGFGGAAAARALVAADPTLSVTLIEREATISTGPGSSAVVAGLREAASIRFTPGPIAGVVRRPGEAAAVDPTARRLRLKDGAALDYDRLILAPGVDIDWDGLPGYDRAAANIMPHAWTGEAQTILLRNKLAAMPDGGTVVMSIPANPIRCPIAPYERASLIAWFLKTQKPRSKLLVLDAKEHFSNQANFQAAWAALYPGLLEWVGLPDGGRVTKVEAGIGRFETEFDDHRSDVGNVIPPQRAGAIALAAGVADRTGWCPVDPATYESKLVPGIHVIGDAIIGGAMPKAAFAAGEHARACAAAIVASLRGGSFTPMRLENICYGLAAPGYGFSVRGAYLPNGPLLNEIEGSGKISPPDAPAEMRAREAEDADDWYRQITAASFA
jgi:sulfide dehydrogenase [flavocytochrome c] flavoprotein subunit